MQEISNKILNNKLFAREAFNTKMTVRSDIARDFKPPDIRGYLINN